MERDRIRLSLMNPSQTGRRSPSSGRKSRLLPGAASPKSKRPNNRRAAVHISSILGMTLTVTSPICEACSISLLVFATTTTAVT